MMKIKKKTRTRTGQKVRTQEMWLHPPRLPKPILFRTILRTSVN
jgi:hypothetical protein